MATGAGHITMPQLNEPAQRHFSSKQPPGESAATQGRSLWLTAVRVVLILIVMIAAVGSLFPAMCTVPKALQQKWIHILGGGSTTKNKEVRRSASMVESIDDEEKAPIGTEAEQTPRPSVVVGRNNIPASRPPDRSKRQKCLQRKRSSATPIAPLANMSEFNQERSRTDTCRVLDPTGGYGWKFVRYEPSALEKHWKIAEAPVDRIFPGLCPLWVKNFSDAANTLDITVNAHMRDNTDTMATSCAHRGGVLNNSTVSPREFDHAMFSRYRYEYDCIRPPCDPKDKPAEAPEVGSERYSYIEPLVGTMRHPLYCHNIERYVFNKSYMIMERWDVVRTHEVSERNFYFDVGASTWNDGLGGPSQNWFYERFVELCARFTDFYAWEAKHIFPPKVFAEAPGPLKPHYHWYNIPIKVALDSWDNPNNHVLAEANVEDFVVYKIDFDQPTLEGTMIQQILQNKELSDLIDELYFEYHVNQDVMNLMWETTKSTVYHQDSLALFTALRVRGIRAHSWL